jgi:adenylate cyclase
MNTWRRITQAIGALPLHAVTWGLAALLAIWAVADLMALNISSGLAHSTYDAMVRARVIAPPRDPRIVIVDIDEYSLQTMAKEFGRWPWPRDTLATVLTHIEEQQPTAIAWDILFADADRLSPGGDKAFNEAAARSTRSHFSVTRLPATYDAQSQITRAVLPGLWLGDKVAQGQTSTVALIAPVLPAVAAGNLGFNNGYPDADGVLRRYRYTERLPDGSAIQSLAWSLKAKNANQATINLVAPRADFIRANGYFYSKNKAFQDPLVVWRQQANSYPRVAFADVFAQAEGGKPRQAVGNFAGKIVLMGSTASSLHDIHPTPLAAQHAGIDVLATAIDNALNDHHLAELPAALQALLAAGLVLGMAAWVLRHGVSSLDAALLPLPAVLLAISYASLHVGSIFVDLHSAAGVALLFITLLKVWNGWRRNHWCGDLPQQQKPSSPVALLGIHSLEPLADAGLDRLIRQLELHAKTCRIIGGDATASWPARLRWPEALQQVCVTGSAEDLAVLQKHLATHPNLRAIGQLQPLPADAHTDRTALAQAAAAHLFKSFSASPSTTPTA